jgi:hypothetical protein
VAWSQVHSYDGTIAEWLRLLEKHLEDAERCGDPAVLGMYLGWLGNVRIFHGDVRGSLASIDRALALARPVNAQRTVPATRAQKQEGAGSGGARTYPPLPRYRGHRAGARTGGRACG